MITTIATTKPHLPSPSPSWGGLGWGAPQAPNLATSIVLLCLLLLTTPAQAQSLLERSISLATGGTVALTGLRDALGSTPHADRLQLRDDDGVWLEAQDVSLEWTRRALFSRELRIDRVSAARATITRLPKSSGTSTGPPELPLHLTVTQLNIDRVVIAAPVAGAAAALSVEGNGAWDGAQSANLLLNLRRLDAEGAYRIDGEATPARVQARLSAQEPEDGLIASLAGIPGLGALNLAATVNGDFAAIAFDASAGIGVLGATPVHLTGAATHAQDGTISLRLDQAAWQSAEATAHLTLPPNATIPIGDATIHIGNLAEIRQDLTGTLTANVSLDQAQTLAGHVEAIGLPQLDHLRADLDGTATQPGLHIAAAGPLGDLDASATLDANASHLDIATLAAHWRGQTLTLQAPTQIDFANGLAVDRLRLALRGGMIDLAGRLTPTLDLTATIQDLPAALANLARPDLRLEGTIAGDLRLTGTLNRPDGQIHLTAANLHRTGDPLPPATATVEATFAEAQAHLTAQLRQGPARADFTGTIPLDPTAGAMDITATLRNLPAALANLAFPGPRLEGTLAGDAHLTGALLHPEGQLRLTATGLRRQGDNLPPATATIEATIANDQARGTAQLRLAAAQATITGTIPLDPAGALDLTATIRNLPASVATLARPGLQLEGTIAGDIRLTGPLAHPDGRVRLTATGLRPPGGAWRPATASLDATIANNQARLTAQASMGAAQANLTGTLPLDQAAQIDLRLAAHADLAMLDPILNAAGRRARGAVRIDAAIAGRLAAPTLNGTLTLHDGTAEDAALGARLTAIQLRLHATGDTIVVDQFTAHAGEGTIGVRGQISLATGLPLDLTLTARAAAPLTGDKLSATLDADLTLRGNALATMALAGRIHVDRAEIRVPEKLPVQVVVLDVRRPGAKLPPPSPTADMTLDLAVDAPGRVFVRGRGIDAELGGKIHVGGTAASPQVDGRFTLQRGQITLLGRPLVFTAGTIGLDGGERLDPRLDFTATSQGVSGTSKLIISGTASAPKFVLSSVPPLPQDEAMAQLLFGQNVAQLSPFQLAQVAAGLAQLAGVGTGFDPLDKIRQNLGLDRLSVGAGADGRGTSIEAGRVIAPGIYLGARQSASGAGTQATVQFDLGHGFKLHADVGTESSSALPPGTTESNGSGVGISWQHEY